MLLLLAAAAIPLVALSAALAWRAYESAVRDTVEIAGLGRESAAAAYRDALGATERLMAALAEQVPLGQPDFTPAACNATLSLAITLGHDAYADLMIVDRQGHAVCGEDDGAEAGGPVTALGALGAALPAGAPRLVEPVRLAAGEVLGLALPVPSVRHAAGALVAGLRPEPLLSLMRTGLHDGVSVWLFPRTSDTPFQASGTQAALPLDPMVAVSATGSGVVARARDGSLLSYASRLLPGGLRLLAGYRADADLAQARRTLVIRLVILAALLGVAFVLTGTGIHHAMVRPLKDLAVNVRRWRGGGPFRPHLQAGVPTEVTELSLAFSEATQRLAEREAQVRAALVERDLVMQEIHHRVKNNLQIVASLLNLQAGRLRQPEARAEFLSARNRVRALATLHRHLYLHGDLHRINMRSFLTELCGQLFEAMGETEGHRIHLSIEATELEMSSDQAVPLALIVTETVSNALKYAFPRPRRGAVAVRLTMDDPRTARLTVEDDGVGLPPGQSETDTGTRDGLGIQLVRGFARQIGATLHVHEDGGTRYTVLIPLQAGAPPSAA